MAKRLHGVYLSTVLNPGDVGNSWRDKAVLGASVCGCVRVCASLRVGIKKNGYQNESSDVEI